MSTQKIGFIGGGNMAQAIISGLIASGIDSGSIMVSDPVDAVREMLSAKGVQVTTDNEALIAFVDTLVLAIKPQLFEPVLLPLKGKFGEQLIVSIAAGVTIDSISKLLDHDKIVRCMPNTPALVQAGATGLFAGGSTTEADKANAEQILSATGVTIWVDSEDKLHAVTAVSGSAPAYFFYVMESMIEAGQQLGLTEEQAKLLTLQTAYGASKMAINSEDSPTVLRQKVTSPNGTTHAAIESMKADKMADTIFDAMNACVLRSKEMAENP